MDFTEIAGKRFTQHLPLVKNCLGELISALPESTAEDYLRSGKRHHRSP